MKTNKGRSTASLDSAVAPSGGALAMGAGPIPHDQPGLIFTILRETNG